MATFVHDPDAVLDYSVDWSAWLAGDTIASAAWTSTAGVTILDDPAPTVEGSVAKVWLSGGTTGQRESVTCHVVTAEGREDDRTFWLSVAQR